MVLLLLMVFSGFNVIDKVSAIDLDSVSSLVFSNEIEFDRGIPNPSFDDNNGSNCFVVVIVVVRGNDLYFILNFVATFATGCCCCVVEVFISQVSLVKLRIVVGSSNVSDIFDADDDDDDDNGVIIGIFIIDSFLCIDDDSSCSTSISNVFLILFGFILFEEFFLFLFFDIFLINN